MGKVKRCCKREHEEVIYKYQWTAVVQRQPALFVNLQTNGVDMWSKPIITEIAIGLEINSYACAEK